MFEITQMECRWRKGIRDCIPAGMLHNARAQIQEGLARQATQGRGRFNRYRPFRRASDMRCMLYVICCRMCILGQVDAILGIYVEHSGNTWVYLGAILSNVGAILWPLWAILGVLGSTLELKV